jgi:hypothetical protein
MSKLWDEISHFCEMGNKKKHKEIADWIQEQYDNHGLPISSLALQVNTFNK